MYSRNFIWFGFAELNYYPEKEVEIASLNPEDIWSSDDDESD